MRYASFAAICGKICDMRICAKYVDPKSVRRIVGIGTVGIGSVGIGTCTQWLQHTSTCNNNYNNNNSRNVSTMTVQLMDCDERQRTWQYPQSAVLTATLYTNMSPCRQHCSFEVWNICVRELYKPWDRRQWQLYTPQDVVGGLSATVGGMGPQSDGRCFGMGRSEDLREREATFHDDDDHCIQSRCDEAMSCHCSCHHCHWQTHHHHLHLHHHHGHLYTHITNSVVHIQTYQIFQTDNSDSAE